MYTENNINGPMTKPKRKKNIPIKAAYVLNQNLRNMDQHLILRLLEKY